MRDIEINGQLVAIIHKANEWKKGLDFLTSDDLFIQTGTWWYDNGKELRAHRHIINERKIDRTQETIVIVEGSLRLDLYDSGNNIVYQEVLTKGDVGIILNGGHGYQILEDNSKIVEVKNGPFESVEKDKELF